MPDGPCQSCNASWLRSEDQFGNQEIGHEPGCPTLGRSKSDCACGETHYACDCQIAWRREAEAVLREFVAWDAGGPGAPVWREIELAARARRLLVEDKPDA